MIASMGLRMSSIHGFLTGVVFLIMISVPINSFAQSEDYLPLSNAEVGRQFRLAYIGSLDTEHLIEKISIGPYGAKTHLSDNQDIIFTGQDRHRKDWSFAIAGKGPAFAYDLYTADLDKNGYRDAILIFPTGGNGLAPSLHIVTLMFDASGRPIPFEADGYFQYDKSGISDLIDMNGDGKAELIYMNFDDGYWITNLYQVNDGRWTRVKGKFERRTYPLFTRFTFRPNHHSVKPRPDKHPYAPDLSNATAMIRGHLLSYQEANVSNSADILLMIQIKANKRVCKPDSWFSSFSVLVDEPSGRRIASLSASSEAVKSLLDYILSKKYGVATYGQRRASQCSPELLWAQPKSMAGRE